MSQPILNCPLCSKLLFKYTVNASDIYSCEYCLTEYNVTKFKYIYTNEEIKYFTIKLNDDYTFIQCWPQITQIIRNGKEFYFDFPIKLDFQDLNKLRSKINILLNFS